MKSRTIVIYVFSLLVLISCKDKDTDNPEGNTGTKLAFEGNDFIEFYDKFSSDSMFQIEHIVFPLEGTYSPEEGQSQPTSSFRWNKEDWIIHKKFDDHNGTFSKEMLDINGLIVEKIEDASGNYSMERRFAKLQDQWHLIYYRSMGLYPKAEK